MIINFATVDASTAVSALGDTDFAGFEWFVERRALPIVNMQKKVVGIITQGDYLKATELESSSHLSVLEAGSTNLLTIDEDELVQAAVIKMLKLGIERLIVVSSANPGFAVGYLDRSAVMNARLRWYEEEHYRERPMSQSNSNSGIFALPGE
jgi:CBS domain-containing protein